MELLLIVPIVIVLFGYFLRQSLHNSIIKRDDLWYDDIDELFEDAIRKRERISKLVGKEWVGKGWN